MRVTSDPEIGFVEEWRIEVTENWAFVPVIYSFVNYILKYTSDSPNRSVYLNNLETMSTPARRRLMRDFKRWVDTFMYDSWNFASVLVWCDRRLWTSGSSDGVYHYLYLNLRAKKCLVFIRLFDPQIKVCKELTVNIDGVLVKMEVEGQYCLCEF